MNDFENHFFACDCAADEHTLRFVVDLDPEDPNLTTSIFLNDWRPWYKRLVVAVKYLFGYKCRYGHWDTWMLRRDDAGRLRVLLDEFINATEKSK